ncbi:MAG TPA: response regulator [Chitinophagaceae bacterium]|nr:response regulator [Chitinophagaceae bacterium]HUM64370.1 response regulator [Chitinophagaceae bacterium]
MFNPESELLTNELKNTPHALIIDDETDICFLLKGILRHKNIDAAYASTLAEGRQYLRQHDADIIFIDNHLPDGYGVEQVRNLKKQNPFCKIVMITAHDTSTDRELAYREGVDYFIGKPFTREVIFKTVEKLI